MRYDLDAPEQLPKHTTPRTLLLAVKRSTDSDQACPLAISSCGTTISISLLELYSMWPFKNKTDSNLHPLLQRFNEIMKNPRCLEWFETVDSGLTRNLPLDVAKDKYQR